MSEIYITREQAEALYEALGLSMALHGFGALLSAAQARGPGLDIHLALQPDSGLLAWAMSPDGVDAALEAAEAIAYDCCDDDEQAQALLGELVVATVHVPVVDLEAAARALQAILGDANLAGVARWRRELEELQQVADDAPQGTP